VSSIAACCELVPICIIKLAPWSIVGFQMEILTGFSLVFYRLLQEPVVSVTKFDISISSILYALETRN
jgi:hypothetical protein